jgi:hypothetical protein
VALESELKVEVVLEMVVEAEIELDVVLTIVAVLKLENELVVVTEDRFSVSTEAELGTMLVEETEDVILLENWYKLNPFGPPQISILFAAHAILPMMCLRVSRRSDAEGVRIILTSSVNSCHTATT